MTILINLLLGLHILLCFLLVVVVLMQRPKNEGLGAAFGGGMTENIFGARTTDVLQRFTSYLAGGFFLLTVLLAFLYAKQSVGDTAAQRLLLSTPAASPPASATTGTPGAPSTTAPAAKPDAAPPSAVPATSPPPEEAKPAASAAPADGASATPPATPAASPGAK
jgi:preprotein translocase subunit SecG